MNGAKWFGVALALCALAAAAWTASATVKTYSHVFAPGDLTIERFGGPFLPGPIVDTTRASIAGPTSAGAGDEIHIIFQMAPGTALKFLPTADFYIIEANLWNNGGSVNVVSTSQINFNATNINDQPGTLDYETSDVPSWRAQVFASRSQFLTDPTQPGLFTEIHTSFTIPAGYPTVNFAEVYMNIGAWKNNSPGQQPPAEMMLQTAVIPEPSSLAAALLIPLTLPMIRRRRH